MGQYTHPTLAEREEIMLMRHEGRRQNDGQELVPGRRRTGTRSSPTSRGSRRQPARSSIPCCRTIPRRGANGNAKGLVREYFSKGTDFDAAGDERVREVYVATSRRPRKHHGFRTP